MCVPDEPDTYRLPLILKFEVTILVYLVKVITYYNFNSLIWKLKLTIKY